MKDLPALNGASMETMRLYPIAVAQIRTANKDFVFGGHLIQEGEMIYLVTAVPHFQSEFYPDADKFDIDRYAKPRAEHMPNGAYLPYRLAEQTPDIPSSRRTSYAFSCLKSQQMLIS